MSRLDLVIFGASGFTGKHAVLEMVTQKKKYSGLTWGIAGRSKEKLEDVKAEVAKKTGEDLTGIKVIIADVKDEASLKEMCSQAKVLVNCCGPYRFYGEPVVRAAIDCKAHYVDVSGEPEFIEKMQLEYNQQAADAGVFIISACGFDCIPNDMGVILAEKSFDGTVNSVESYISAEVPPEVTEKHGRAVINYGTWESLIYSLAYSDELKSLRKKLYPEPLPSFKPKLSRRLLHKKDGKWCLPFLGADESTVYRTQRALYEQADIRPAHFKAYLEFDGLFYALAVAIGFILINVFTKMTFTRKLLLDYPTLFSCGMVSRSGPPEEVSANTKFRFRLHTTGWKGERDLPPQDKLVVQVSGCNPGYGATVVALLLAAITILTQRDVMPQTGGVMTTGIAFRNTQLIERLNENNFKFQVLSEEQ